MRNLVSICKGWYYQNSPFWLQEILIFMLMTARTRMLQNSKIYCLNLDYNNMWMCQLTETDTRSIFPSPGWAIIPHWTSQLQATTKTEYYSWKVQEYAGDQKKLFEIIKSLTKPLQQEQYPDSDSLQDLADAFDDFFMMKIQKIRTKLDSQDPEPITIPRVPVKEEDMFLSFQPLTEDDVRKLIKQSPNKQCSSDPIPTWLLKECLDSLLPVLTLLVNKSLQIGFFPEEWKNAVVKPLLKKLGLELVFPSFRPVSNLPLISKLTEKA